jgi:predicted nuclease of restriction endonuclease-like (RecB) superfamily
MTLVDPYQAFIGNLKTRIQQSQTRAALAVSRELIELYWHIGKEIVTAQKLHNWGDKVLEQIAKDLKASLPGITGFSRTTLYRVRNFYLTYAETSEIVPPLVGQLPWAHNVVLLEKIKDPTQRLWYAQQTLENGWSRI